MSLIATLALITLAVLPLPASAWNIPGHMLSGIIAYQILQQENPPTIDRVKAVLEKHPWYANQWQARFEDVPVADRDLVLFMQASRWADDIRTQDRTQNRPSWHYVNLPFKPEGQPDSVQAREPEPVNVLSFSLGFTIVCCPLLRAGVEKRVAVAYVTITTKIFLDFPNKNSRLERVLIEA